MRRRRRVGSGHGRVVTALVGLLATGAVLAACGSSPASSSSTTSTTSTTTSGRSPAGTSFHTANVAGLGSVVVDGRGYTVYVLSSGTTKNLPCTSASGCTTVWPALALPNGTTTASAGSGIQTSLLATQTVGSVTYPTYNGWRLYEYSGDTGPGQSGGQGITSYGGSWHALSASATPVVATPTTTTGSPAW